ncbi:MAG TPA: pitrilysin family protein, partial [Gemmatimonadales bacterium]|nr:pitrilysin family protein [Gemmatimonadales bacterium]
AALTLAVTPAAPPAAAQQLAVPITIDTLDNGLTLIVHEDHSAPVVAVNVWYHVGSGDEKPGRTGFAHLFEHLMFMGSAHAPYPAFDRMLEAVGANNNGSTDPDRTNYFEWGPSNALPLMLWLEADRMGWMLPTMDSAKVDAQRDVVKNERRQRVENQPYGMVSDVQPPLMFPSRHPYSWPVIGSMADLSAASVEDVKEFFRIYYAPNNASIVVAGDVKTAEVKALVRQYFGGIPRGPAIERPAAGAPRLARDTSVVLEDRVQLPRLYLTWLTPKGWDKDDAALSVAAYVLSGAKSSRLDKALVYEEELASSMTAYQDGRRLAGQFEVITTARPGKTLGELQARVDQIIATLGREGPTARELEQAKNSIESRFLRRMEMVIAKADMLNQYQYAIGTPDGFQKDIDRIRAVSAEDVKRVVTQYLSGPRGQVSVVPEGRRELAAPPRGVQP